MARKNENFRKYLRPIFTGLVSFLVLWLVSGFCLRLDDTNSSTIKNIMLIGCIGTVLAINSYEIQKIRLVAKPKNFKVKKGSLENKYISLTCEDISEYLDKEALGIFTTKTWDLIQNLIREGKIDEEIIDEVIGKLIQLPSEERKNYLDEVFYDDG